MSERQLNLFGFDSSKKPAPKSNTILLPLDTLILLGVVIILLLTIAFSLGVEKGRRSSRLAKQKQQEESADFTMLETAQITTPQIKAQEKVATPKSEPVVEKKSVAVAKDTSGPRYIIQVAAYMKDKKELAVKEMQKLKSQGFPAMLSESGKYLVLAVGEFTDRSEADSKLAELKKQYSDCYIKKK